MLKVLSKQSELYILVQLESQRKTFMVQSHCRTSNNQNGKHLICDDIFFLTTPLDSKETEFSQDFIAKLKICPEII